MHRAALMNLVWFSLDTHGRVFFLILELRFVIPVINSAGRVLKVLSYLSVTGIVVSRMGVPVIWFVNLLIL